MSHTHPLITREAAELSTSKVSLTPQIINGRAWVQNLPKVCPWCGSVFFAYQLEESPQRPYQMDPEPPIVNDSAAGQRETCGHPLCWKSEQTHQVERSPAYVRARDGLYNKPTEEAAPAPKKAGGLKRMGDK